jgi:hypothetical protein
MFKCLEDAAIKLKIGLLDSSFLKFILLIGANLGFCFGLIKENPKYAIENGFFKGICVLG